MEGFHIQGSDIERKMFKRLEERVDDHDIMVKMYEEELGLDTPSGVV